MPRKAFNSNESLGFHGATVISQHMFTRIISGHPRLEKSKREKYTHESRVIIGERMCNMDS